jgi:hypothetical protein
LPEFHRHTRFAMRPSQISVLLPSINKTLCDRRPGA